MEIVQGARSMFERLAAELAPACASVTFDDGGKAAELIVTVTPRNKLAAPIEAFITVDDIMLRLGHECRAELGGPSADAGRVVRDAERICRGVIGGRLEETVYRRRDNVVAATGRLRLDGETLRFWSNALFPLTLGSAREHHVYEPYLEGQVAGSDPESE